MRRRTISLLCLAVSVSLVSGIFLKQDTLKGRTGHDSHEKFLQSIYHELPVREDGPEYAGFREYLMTMNPGSREVPEKAWLKSAEAIEGALERGSLKSGERFDWEEIPANSGGRTRALMFDPNDPARSKVWAGGVTGGLWYNEDIFGDGDWQTVDDFWPSLAISCMAYDPNEPMDYYVGTGEGQTAVVIYRESSGRGNGIWKSSDGGRSWEVLESTAGLEYITDIAIRDEEGKSVLYAGVSSGIYKEKIHASRPSEGLFRSEDGGETWVQVLPLIDGGVSPYSPSCVKISASGRIFVGTMRNIFQEGGGRILYSDNGVDWTLVDTFVPVIEALDSWNIPGRVMIACAPSNAGVVYAILSGAQVTPGDEFIRSQGVMIIKSSDGGKNWLKVNMPDPSPYTRSQWSFLAWHALTAAVQPDDPDVLWVGGLDLYRSDNGGWSYEQKSLWWNFGVWYKEEFPPYVHADQHNLQYRPGSSDELLSSNDGGVFLAADSKATAPRFVEKSNGYNTLQYYSCAIHPEAGKRYFLGGCQDNGTFRSGDEPTSKKVSVSYGDGTYCFIDENEPNIQISGSQFNTLYYSRDGEHNETRSYNFPGGTFVNPMDYDPDDNIIYANGMSWDGSFRDYLFIIRLANDTLLQLIPVPAGTGSSVPFSAIHRMPWKQKGNPVILAGSESGRLFRITLQALPGDQYSATSSEMGGGQLPAGYISCVQSGRSSQQILLTYSSYGVKHVWETTDGGSTWKDKTGNLPDMPVRWAIYLPGTDNGVMLATEHGIWYTLDISQENITWVKAGGVFPNVRVDMLRSRKSDGYILAGTHGRGLFISPAPFQLNDKPSVSPEGMLSLYPNPASDYIVLKIKGMDPGVVRLEIYDASGRLQVARSLDFNAGKTRRLPVAELPAGSYILRLGNENWNISHTFIKKE